ncbi:protein adenylyltransferase SelO [Peptoniphilus sp. HCN-40583]|uniref:protein adenylyltransferase SelO n=1 Tax=Peptoniphilus sp. HCN-40583 TaxID=3134662 RepID=UPI0030BA56DC
MFNLDNSYGRLPRRFYRKVEPTPVADPAFFITNNALARELGIDDEALFSEEGLDYLSGNALPEGAASLAMAYMGHQFGYPAMLGDGRAILLGEQIAPDGRRVDIQLKGAGQTPFSRMGDGRAALGPMLREYILSEAMYHLGVPTTRALAVVSTGQCVQRTEREQGAILTRVAESHLRVGTFEWLASIGGDVAVLLDYALKRHDPDLLLAPDRGGKWLVRVAERQADLIARWMALGFVHGVMNTDNMTISGETIDYGPCAFLDAFNPKTVFSSIDHFGRYRFENQGQIGVYNLSKLGEALGDILGDEKAQEEKIKAALEAYGDTFQKAYFRYMARRLGFHDADESVYGLINEWLDLLMKEELDYNESFLRLTHGDERDDWSSGFSALYEKIISATGNAGEGIRRANNPAIFPRNYLVERAIQEAEAGDKSFLLHFMKLLEEPYAHNEEQMALRGAPAIPGYKTFCGT